MTLELRTSERAAFLRCQKRWYWGYVEGLKPYRLANPLWFGQLVHEALASWYLPGNSRGPHPVETFRELLETDGDRSVKSYEDRESPDYVSAIELGEEMMFNYINHYRRDDNWDVIATEQPGTFWLPKLGSRRGRHIKYVFIFDGVYRDLETGKIWLMEHKTAAGINLLHLPLDRQASSYWAVCDYALKQRGLIKQTDEIAGIMFNFLRKAKADVRPRNENGHRTNQPLKKHFHEEFRKLGIPFSVTDKLERLQEMARATGTQVLGDVSLTQPAPLFIREPVFRMPEERKMQLQRIREDAWHIMKARDPEQIYPLTKNPTKDCAWDCPFFNMCQLDEAGDAEAVEDMKYGMYYRGDAYEQYRKAA